MCHLHKYHLPGMSDSSHYSHYNYKYSPQLAIQAAALIRSYNVRDIKVFGSRTVISWQTPEKGVLHAKCLTDSGSVMRLKMGLKLIF